MLNCQWPRQKQKKPVQSLVFDRDALFKWLQDAPSEGSSLLHKLIALVCYYGTCRIAEIVAIKFDDVIVRESEVLVRIRRCKSATSEAETQIIIPQTPGVDVVALFNAYIAALGLHEGRFWHPHRNGKWQPLKISARTPSRRPH